ncbi:hypothetical protein BVRB_4g082800 [Beta vulgaris subsp. vulgaris]|nr:hypothetical protein BVRB_4g082800 [Beta vulgaris subsp. vulgaris]
MAIGETILGVVLQVVLDKLDSRQIIDFFKSLKLDQSHVNKLKHLMLVAEKLLADAEQKQISNSAVKSWLIDLKHLFYRAEEIVDEIATEALHSSMNLIPGPESFRTKIRNSIPAFSSSSSFVNIINSKIKEVVTELEHMVIVSHSSALDLKEVSVSKTSGRVPTSYLLEDTGVFGRDQEKEWLLQLLLSKEAEENLISVIAIVGIGGLGKTTLAKLVYNDDRLGSFDLKAWVYVSDQEFFARLEDGNTTPKISEKSRYFSYFQDHFDGSTKFESLCAAKYLRTFAPMQTVSLYTECYLTDKISVAIIPQFHCLRVLSLSSYRVLRLPESIKHLKQLRFLDVSRTGIKELPESVSTLYNLQTLLLSGCSHLERLPADTAKDISRTSSLKQMPKQMGKLHCLQTLTAFVVSKHDRLGMRELGELQQIRGELALRRLQNISSPAEASYANLNNREYLYNVELDFDAKDNSDSEKGRAVLENLKPHANLERLTIRNYPGTRFPCWLDTQFSMYGNISHLSLIGCQYCCSLPALGQLVSLKQLKIVGMDHIMTIGSEFYGYDSGLRSPFPVLQNLVFKEMKSWELWSEHEKEASLEELQIEGCKRLVSLHLQPPSVDCSPLLASAQAALGSSLTTLKLHSLPQSLHISNCISLESLPEAMALLTLERIFINMCPRLKLASNETLPTSLQSLSVRSCKSLQFPIPMERIEQYSSLSFIFISNIGGPLVSFPLGTLPKLRALWLSDCRDLETLYIPRGIDLTNLTSLQKLRILRCPKLVYVGKTQMRRVVDLPAFNLRHLDIRYCGMLKPLAGDREGLPSKLESLYTDGFDKMTLIFSCLRKLEISCHLTDYFPCMNSLPISITLLVLSNFPNLKSLNGKALKSLASIQQLWISDCPNLQYLPEEGLPASLGCLRLQGCPLLEERCQRDKGDDWRKIDHIACVCINYIPV